MSKEASPRLIVTLESRQNDEIEKAAMDTGVSKTAIVRLGGYLLAKSINSGKIEETLLETLKELGEINKERGETT